MGSHKEDVNILQYADDTLFFGSANIDNVRVLKSIMRSFENWTQAWEVAEPI